MFDAGASVVAEHWRFTTARDATSDELGAMLANLLGLRGLSFDDVGGTIVSSTVPQLYDQWRTLADRYLGHGCADCRPVAEDGDADPDRQPA